MREISIGKTKASAIFFLGNNLRGFLLAGLLLTGSGRVDGAEMNTPEDQVAPWEFDLIAYVWMPSIRGTSAVPGAGNTKITFRDILENLDMTAMLAGNVRKGDWYVYGNMVHMDLESDVRVTGSSDVDIELKSWITELGAGYWVIDDGIFSLGVIAGARYLYIDGSAEGAIINLGQSQKAWNGIAGFDSRYQLPGNWSLYGHVDAGTGNTQFTWQVLGSLAYRFDKWSASAGYRHVVWDFDEDDDFGKVYKDLSVSGPYLAVKRSF